MKKAFFDINQVKTIDDYKIILIGNQGVGKTNFFRKLHTGKFYEKYIPSVGIDRIKYNFSSNLVDNGIVAEKNFGSILMKNIKHLIQNILKIVME